MWEVAAEFVQWFGRAPLQKPTLMGETVFSGNWKISKQSSTVLLCPSNVRHANPYKNGQQNLDWSIMCDHTMEDLAMKTFSQHP
jgi:hypothetical protein